MNSSITEIQNTLEGTNRLLEQKMGYMSWKIDWWK